MRKMFLKAYAILDTKVGVYAQPFFCQHDQQALRSIIEAVADERSTLSKYPADFVLYRIGEYDDSIGHLSALPPVNLGIVAAVYASHLSALNSSVRRVSGPQEADFDLQSVD